MKTMIILGLIQTALLLFLFGKFVLFEEELIPASHVSQDTSVGDNTDKTQPLIKSGSSYVYLDEDLLRQIIREELAAQSNQRSGSVGQMDIVFEPSPAEKANNQYQRDLVTQQLEYHTSVGSISNTDMQKLQGEIAKLDAAGQTEMLSKLTGALNSGKLEGQL
jgi:hypothetical protein